MFNGDKSNGFYCNLGKCAAIWAELWVSLDLGLLINCHSPRSSLNLILRWWFSCVKARHSSTIALKSILDEILELFGHSDCSTSITHAYREANWCANYLPRRGHMGPFSWIILESVPQDLG